MELIEEEGPDTLEALLTSSQVSLIPLAAFLRRKAIKYVRELGRDEKEDILILLNQYFNKVARGHRAVFRNRSSRNPSQHDKLLMNKGEGVGYKNRMERFQEISRRA